MTRSMLVVDEYTGSLVDGPDSGNFVTSSVQVIPVKSTVEVWLDGNIPQKTSRVTIVEGVYRWNSEKHLFKWEPHTATFYEKKETM